MSLKSVLLLFLVLAAGLWSTNVAANNSCFDFRNKHEASCRSAYLYDTVDVYFKDDAGREQSVVVKRVRDLNRNVVHADYDFVVNCPGGCADANTAVHDVLWAWRNAWVDNRFYIKEEVCDPTLTTCCDASGNCTQPFDHSESNAKGVVKTQRNPGNKVDKWLDRTDKGVRIWDTIFRDDTSNGEEVKQELVENNAQMPKFIIQQTPGGAFIVCALKDTSGNCEHIPGRATVGEGSGIADFNHDFGREFNAGLDSFLSNWFSRDQGMQCSQSMSCDMSGNHCRVTLTCHKP